MAGYHSPQVDVAVRLNTNESPEPPPAAWLAAYAEAVRTHRLAPLPRPGRQRPAPGRGRAARRRRPSRCSWPTARTRCCRRCCWPTAAPGARPRCSSPPTPCTATSPAHRHRGGRGRAGGRLLHRPRRGPAGSSPRRRPSITFLCSPNNPTGMVDDEATVRETLALAEAGDALLVVDEAYGQFAPWSAARPGGRRRAPGGDPHVLQDVVDGRPPASATSSAPPRWWPSSTRWCCRTTSTRPSSWPGCWPSTTVDEMEARVARLVEERGRLAAALADLPVDVWPSGANFILFRPRRGRRRRGLAGPARPVGAGAQLLDLAPPRGLPARHRRHPRRRRCLPRRSHGDPHMTDLSPAPMPTAREPRPAWPRWPAPPRRPTSPSTSPSTAPAGSRCRPGIPFFDHMLGQLGRHGGFDLTVRAAGDLEIDAHHTVEDVGIALGEVFRTALGDKAGVRRFASTRVPARRGAGRRGPRPVGPPVPRLRGRLPRREDPGRPAVRPPAGRGVLAGLRGGRRPSRCTSRSCAGRNTHHIIEATFKAVARSLRDAVRVEGAGIPSTKGTL